MGQQKAAFTVYHTRDFADFTQHLIKAHQAVGFDFGHQIPIAIRGIDRRNLGNFAKRSDHGARHLSLKLYQRNCLYRAINVDIRFNREPSYPP